MKEIILSLFVVLLAFTLPHLWMIIAQIIAGAVLFAVGLIKINLPKL